MERPIEQKLVLSWPPSVNGYWRCFRNRAVLSKAGRLYKQSAPPPFSPYTDRDRLAVSIDFYPPTKRRLDLDNHAKACCDLLQHWRVFPDDSQIDELHLYRLDVEKPGRAEIRIKVL